MTPPGFVHSLSGCGWVEHERVWGRVGWGGGRGGGML